MAVQLLIMGLLLLAAPLLAGGIFADMDQRAGGLAFQWTSGQFCLWAGFQLICVPLMLLRRDFSDVIRFFSAYCAVMVLCGVIRLAVCRRRRKAAREEGAIRQAAGKPDRAAVLWWVVFAVLLVFQLAQAVGMTYADGDDAFYVGVSTTVEDSGLLYEKLPYTGAYTGLDARHGLAPLPVWVAYLAKLSGMETVVAAHLMLPAVLIAFAYAVFYLLGLLLFPEKDEKLPLFLVFTEILVLFGNYSIYTVENFLIARSRQGKAALGSIVIPFLFVLMGLWLKRQEEKERIPARLYLLIAMTVITGCLCSTQGALLVGLLAGITGLVGAAVHKRWGRLALVALCCIPCVGFAVLYFLLE